MAKRQANHGQGAGGAGEHLARLDDLARAFTTFRRRHQAGKRIPLALRQGAVAAQRNGVSVRDLRKHCGVTEAQLARWAAMPMPERAETRRFAVLPEAEAQRWASEAFGGAAAVQLQIGGWSIVIAPSEG